nr:zinc-binding dehydrogenase [Chamaesiphon sp. VAR_69_metabat_338]
MDIECRDRGRKHPNGINFCILTIQPDFSIKQGIYVGSREMFETMNRAFSLHRIQPAIDRVFPFVETPDAYRYLQSGSHFGKVVI